ncbi:delphilin-like isoform X5 [Patiria miniata]|uniref:Delphilin n=1 Tax=Patiria miniata TaxID=46514 RepID=A0A914ALL3_PATMI|nr:delphilin-like isoform X5 [Patiria miniata]
MSARSSPRMPSKTYAQTSRSGRSARSAKSARSAGRSSKQSGNTGATRRSYNTKRPALPMPVNNRHWPEDFGFTIAGDAPAYIITVTPNSHAHSAGLQPGDQLVELNGTTVTQRGAQDIQAMARQCPTVPPSIVVVSCVKTVEIVRDPKGRFGMTVIGAGPVYVEVVQPHGAAARGGLRPGDMVLEINGLPIRHSDDTKVFVQGSNKLRMLIIPGAGHQNVRKLAQKFEVQARDRSTRAETFFRKLDGVFYDDPLRKDALVSLLKQYAKDKRVDHFGRALASLLTTPAQRLLFEDIRIFVPPKHRARFDYLVSKDPPISGKRVIQIDRRGGSFGFMLVGHSPVMIESIDPGGAAEKAGLRPGERIMRLNGLDVRRKTHDELILLLKGSGSAPTIAVESGPTMPSSGYSSAPSVTTRSVTTASEVSAISNWLSESALSKGTVDELGDVKTGPMSRKDLYAVGRTFKEMMEHHLTGQERKMVKRALQEYHQCRNLDGLIVELFPVLDTNAKRTLWPYIIQILPEEEQEVCKRKVIYLIDRHAAATSDAQPRVLHGMYLPGFSEGEDETDFTDYPSVSETSYPHQHHSNPAHRKPPSHHGSKPPSKTRPSYPLESEALGLHLAPQPGHDRRKRGSLYTVNPEQLEVVTSMLSDDDSVSMQSSASQAHSSNHPGFNANNNTSILVNGRAGPSSAPSNARATYAPSVDGSERLRLRPHPSSSTPNGRAPSPPGSFVSHASSRYSLTSHHSSSHASVLSNASRPKQLQRPISPPPPPPPPPPPLPPPAPPLPEVNNNNPGWHPGKMAVKRLNWEKIQATENTVWSGIGEGEDYLSDVIKRLELEEKFSVKNKHKTSPKDKKPQIAVINHKKAHNTAILLGHLRLPIEDIKADIIQMNTDKFSTSHLQQMALYAPDHAEIEKLKKCGSRLSQLTVPDKFAYEMSQIPGYKLRIESLLFKSSFDEKLEEISKLLKVIEQAAIELRASQKLAKVLELVLAMGNYMNKGNQRVAGATGFKITFLTELDTTKTADNKSTFLHVVAKAVYANVPEVMTFGDELPMVPKANKVSLKWVNDELQEVKNKLEDLVLDIDKLEPGDTTQLPDDRFTEVMDSFTDEARDRLEAIESLHAKAQEEFNKTAQYFGEDPASTESDSFFGIFSVFTSKFAKAHSENMQKSKSP